MSRKMYLCFLCFLDKVKGMSKSVEETRFADVSREEISNFIKDKCSKNTRMDTTNVVSTL